MIKIPLKAGQQRPASKLASPLWPNIDFWPTGFAIFQGIRTSIAKKTYFCDLSGGGGGGSGPPVASPSGSAHASQEIFSHVGTYPGLNQY